MGCGTHAPANASSPSDTTGGSLSTSTSSVSFGTVQIGQSAQATVTLVNSGTDAVNITAMTVSGSSFTLPNAARLPITVSGGGSYSVSVQFSPSTAGEADGALSLTSDAATGNALQIPLTGVGGSAGSGQGSGGPDLSLSATALAFGTVALNTTATKSLTVTSSGTGPLTISSATVTGTGFSLVGGKFPLTLAVGSTQPLNITYNPAASGSNSGTLTLNSDASSGSVKTVSLSGTGGAAGVLNTLSCSSSSITGSGYDACQVGLTAGAGTGGITLSLASSNPAVQVPATVAIPAGSSSADFSVAVAAVTRSQTATITATAKSISKSFVLQLNGVSASLTVSPGALSFGSVVVNTPATQSVTLTSTGTAPLTISSVATVGGAFSTSGVSFPRTLNPGQSTALTVQFDPSAAGQQSGILVVTSNSSSTPVTQVSLSGTATSATSLGSLTCSNSSVSGSATDRCTVALSGPAPAGGAVVKLSSGNTAISVPSTLSIAAGSSSAVFSANITPVTTQETAAITASMGGASRSFTIQLQAATAQLTVSSTSLVFGNVSVNAIRNLSLTLTSSGQTPITVSSAAMTGAAFSASGATLPLTLAPGSTATMVVSFAPQTSGSFSGSLLLQSNSTTAPQISVALSGVGTAASVLSAVSCSSSKLTGPATDACTVALTRAGTSAVSVQLSSSSSALTVPKSVTIAAGTTSAGFSATSSAVTTVQTATISATSGATSVSGAVELDPPGTPGLTLQSTSVSFGDVSLSSTATQNLTITSSGSSALTITAATLAGSGFNMSGIALPLTLNPGQTAVLDLQFSPTTAGAAAGTLTLSSNANGGATATVALSGTGQATSYQVGLTWLAPANSPVTISGYNVYRAVSGSTAYSRLTSSIDSATSYTDSTVSSGATYVYSVTSVDSSGVESAPSNTFSVAIP